MQGAKLLEAQQRMSKPTPMLIEQVDEPAKPASSFSSSSSSTSAPASSVPKTTEKPKKSESKRSDKSKTDKSKTDKSKADEKHVFELDPLDNLQLISSSAPLLDNTSDHSDAEESKKKKNRSPSAAKDLKPAATLIKTAARKIKTKAFHAPKAVALMSVVIQNNKDTSRDIGCYSVPDHPACYSTLPSAAADGLDEQAVKAAKQQDQKHGPNVYFIARFALFFLFFCLLCFLHHSIIKIVRCTWRCICMRRMRAVRPCASCTILHTSRCDRSRRTPARPTPSCRSSACASCSDICSMPSLPRPRPRTTSWSARTSRMAFAGSIANSSRTPTSSFPLAGQFFLFFLVFSFFSLFFFSCFFFFLSSFRSCNSNNTNQHNPK